MKGLLFEYQIDYVEKDGVNVKVLVNPTKDMLLSYLKKSVWGRLRGYYSVETKEFYFWDAYHMNHMDATILLGLGFDDNNTLHLSDVDEDQVWLTATDDQNIKQSPYFNKMFEKSVMPNTYILKNESKTTTLKEYKIEKVEIPSKSGQKDINVLINPPKDALLSFLEKSNFKELRFVYSGDTFYFWYAHLAVHFTMIRALGLDYNDLALGLVHKDSKFNKPVLSVWQYENTNEDIYQNKYINSIFDITPTKMTHPLRESIIKEYAIERVKNPYRNKDIIVWKNPPKDVLINALKKSKFRELRFILDNGVFYFWDASMLIHQDMAVALGVFYDWNKAGTLFLIPDEGLVRVLASDDILNHVYFSNMFNFFVDGEGTDGLVYAAKINEDLKSIVEYAVKMVDHEPSLKISKKLPVAINPTANEIIQIINKSKADSVRGLYCPNKNVFYFWDAYYYWHEDMIKALEIDVPNNVSLNDICFYIGEYCAKKGIYKVHSTDEIRYGMQEGLMFMNTDYFKKITVKYNTMYILNVPLNEYAVKVLDVETRNIVKKLPVAINPSAKDLEKMVYDSVETVLRGLYCPDKNIFYFWDGYYLTHHNAAELLNVRYIEKYGFYVKYSRDYKNIIAYYFQKPVKMLETDYFKKNFTVRMKNGKISTIADLNVNESTSIKESSKKIIDIDGDLFVRKKFVTHINPSPQELEKLLDNSRGEELRLYYDAKRDIFYVWDAYYLTHLAFADLPDISLPFKIANSFYFKKDLEGRHLLVGYGNISPATKSDYIKKNFTPVRLSSNKIAFELRN